jgi:septal ring factor EnvC (AmiA/AmiB activator)
VYYHLKSHKLHTISVPNANKVVGSCPDEVPHTPVTQAAAEDIMPFNTLIKQDAHALDEISKQRLQRHVQKIASAARISFAECALLQEQNRFLAKINNETKACRSTKSLILGKGKVMSYEDLSEARAKRAAAKEATAARAKRAAAKEGKATAVKRKRGRPRKTPAPDMRMSEAPEMWTRSEALEPVGSPVAHITEPWRATVAQMIDPQMAQPWRAQVARMI